MRQETPSEKSGLVLFAKGVVSLGGIAAIAVCVILLPELAREELTGNPESTHLTYFFLASAYIIALPFFVALYQTFRLLQHIDSSKVFSDHALTALKKIKICAIVFSLLIIIAVIGGISFSWIVNPQEDVTFMITLGGIITFVSGIIAVFITLLEKLLIEAIALKSENDVIV